MLISSWKNRIMAACMGLLLLVSLLTLIHWGVKAITLKIPRLYNYSIIKMALVGTPPDKNEKNPDKNIHIDWAKLYPFDHSIKAPVMKIRYFPKPPKDTPAKRLGDWTEKNLYSYYSLAELQRSYDKTILWNIINPAYNTVSLHDGHWAFVYKKQDMKERIESVASFHNFLQSMRISLTYIQAPGKINKYGTQDAWLRNHYDFSNANADQLLAGLQQNGIDTIDLREYFHETVPEDQYHQLFFRTDHHWLPQTALTAAGFIANHLHQKYGIEINFSNLDANHYNIENLPRYFLGSAGKKVTLSQTQPEDFPILHPDFFTNIHLEVPDKGIKKEGPFEITYDENEIDHIDFYKRNPHSAYGYGDHPLLTINNLQLAGFPRQRVLVIKDSFGDTMVPLLSLGCKNIAAVDIRHFDGSLHALIKEFHPDAVLILYTDDWSNDSINWNSHGDKFDFR
jgi:hypothetical protein|nr:DHHW family protein [uncultured Dialister sp.]